MYRFLLWLLALLLLANPLTHAANKPNVLMIIVDDLRPDIGCYGRDDVLTPNLDKFAQSALVFDRAYCQQAICNPSRSSVLTGLRPDSTGVHGNHTHYREKNPDIETLPQYFKNRGYRTLAIGKINHGFLPEGSSPQPWDTMGDPPSWSEPAIRFGPRYYYTPKGIAAAQALFAHRYPNQPIENWEDKLLFGPLCEAPDVPDNTLFDGKVADAAVTQLERLANLSNNENKPFFLAVGFIKPHTPHIAPRKYWDLYDRADMPLATNQSLPTDAPKLAGHGSGEKRRYTDQPNQGPFSPDNQRENLHGYKACTSFIDAQIGKVLDALEQQQLANNTIVVIWSDHGYHLGEKGLWGKTTNYELDTRVALIVRAPAMDGEKTRVARSNRFVELVDLYPTLLDLCNLPANPSNEGQSFAPLLTDPNQPWKPAAYSQYTRGRHRGYTRVDDRYRYVEWLDMKDNKQVIARELYDHQHDPNETTNLANNPAHAATAERLSKALNQGQGWRSP